MSNTSDTSVDIDCNSLPAIISMLWIGVVGSSVILILPLMLGSMVDDIGLTEAEAGYVTSANMIGGGLGTFFVTFLLSKFPWQRLVKFALVIVVSANIASAFLGSYETLLFMRLISGLGEGLALGIANAAIGLTRNPDRIFGFFVFSALTFSAVSLFFLPYVLIPWGSSGVFLFIALFAVASLAVVRNFPGKIQSSGSSQRISFDKGIAAAFLFGAGAILVYFTGEGGFWTYLDRIGVSNGMDVGTVGRYLGLSSVAGMGGALIAALVNSKFGRTLPLFLCLIVTIISMVIVLKKVTPFEFALSAMLFQFAWSAAIPYFLAVLSSLDMSGRVLVVGVAMQPAGLALGPAIAASLISPGVYHNVVWLGVACNILAFVMIASFTFRQDRKSHTNQSLPA